MATFWYTAYGLTVASDLELPELVETDVREADVRIELRDDVAVIDDPVAVGRIWSTADDEWLQSVDGVGRFRVSNGSVVAIEQWGSDRDVRAFLFGSTLGALLHQRRVLTLHASSFLVDGRAVLVAGNSRAGKSTTLTEMIRRGHPMIADDKTIVFADDGRLVTAPGFPSVRLWPDAAQAAGLDGARLTTVRDGGEKFVWASPGVHDASIDVGALFLLRRAGVDAPRVETQFGPAAFTTVVASTYRRDAMVVGMGGHEAHFELAANVASSVPIHRLLRPRDADSVGEVADAILAAVAT